ncbi:deoxyguanosinetriphosphate triphosphohydrolase [bacterium BMS3Abin01]|nr:deoxyguanosinetriphosphate triphosphohydrolase [bacterium BMS3Abin01]HDZ59704.1 deoxyguanosinetriphosphate triphosphohydrolase [Actinomycetota bacterium]
MSQDPETTILHADEGLSSYARKASESLGRDEPEEPCSLRTCFQRDRDRIVHSKSFRRLKHKTQVFIAPEGDHYRTRITHTLEVSGISRTIARALRLNEDLAEAVSLGHDLGHTPFGHIGEEALSRALMSRTGRRFEHNHQSLRVVRYLEKDGKGLNLCREVNDGILRHTGDAEPQTLEGCIVRIADRIAYINHDIDDALRAGIVSQTDLPEQVTGLLGRTCRQRIDTLVHDLVNSSWERGEIRLSPSMSDAAQALRNYLSENVYTGVGTRRQAAKVSGLVEKLFDYYMENSNLLPRWTGNGESDDAVRVTDYIAGMTDRFAIRTYRELFVPREWGL